MRHHRPYSLSILAACALLVACQRHHDDALSRIKADGEIVMLTRNSPTTYYEGPNGPAGIEYDMAKAFAQELGVRLKVQVVADSRDIIPMLLDGKGQFAAAGLVVTEKRLKKVRFAPYYQEIRPQLVYRLGTQRPQSLHDLVGHNLEISARTNHIDMLQRLRAQEPALRWQQPNDAEVEELLLSVWEGLIEYTVADSNILAINRQYYPELQAAFDLAAPQKLAWAFAPQAADDSLYDAAVRFFTRLRKHELAQLIDRYYGPTQRFNYTDTATYLARINDKLPAYRRLFEQAGLKYNLDWRLLAAVGYQESYWDPTIWASPIGAARSKVSTVARATCAT